MFIFWVMTYILFVASLHQACPVVSHEGIFLKDLEEGNGRENLANTPGDQKYSVYRSNFIIYKLNIIISSTMINIYLFS